MTDDDVNEMCSKLRSAFGRRLPDATIDEMVSRFLRWKLPQDCSPDGSITFNVGHATPASPQWPVGTNLLTASQAREMIEYVIFGNAEKTNDAPNGPSESKNDESELHELLCAYCAKDAKVPATHVFETSTGAETVTCEQHANIAMTCMKHLRRVGT